MAVKLFDIEAIRKDVLVDAAILFFIWDNPVAEAITRESSTTIP
ncbi:isopropylmalate isomerase large subunit [Maribacter sp. HTCC2170]|nr:isopropylmalate isomerase large subunit [Maribacter sp. HTCC2170]